MQYAEINIPNYVIMHNYTVIMHVEHQATFLQIRHIPVTQKSSSSFLSLLAQQIYAFLQETSDIEMALLSIRTVLLQSG